MPGRILLVDDSATVRVLYQHLLAREGFEVILANNGVEAIEVLRKEKSIHLVISDLRMPGMDGLGLVSTIRAMPRLQLLPVLMLTQSEERGDLMRNLQAGVSDYVRKSGDVIEFIARVKNLARVGHLQLELERISQTDSLTGVFNRRHAMQRLQEEIHRSARDARPFSIALLDIDFFKCINDTWGHRAGDDVLMVLTEMMVAHARDGDCLVRWGGEEFLLLLPGTTLKDASRYACRLCEQIRCHTFNIGPDGTPVSITVSGGVSCFVEGDTIDTLLARADEGLYQAKECGRDRFYEVSLAGMSLAGGEENVA